MHAGSDTPEFKRQSGEYAAAWVSDGHPLQYQEMPEHHHFDNILDLADMGSRLFRDLLLQITDA